MSKILETVSTLPIFFRSRFPPFKKRYLHNISFQAPTHHVFFLPFPALVKRTTLQLFNSTITAFPILFFLFRNWKDFFHGGKVTILDNVIEKIKISTLLVSVIKKVALTCLLIAYNFSYMVKHYEHVLKIV